ncbi:hypothetical protein PHYSODRAFT_341943 [Phytophthora sojae]|uniref:Transposase putative helix-turn-helix domain-containing protein n=1 Tax=Phytophthora sojae (strain P6497) TaxID=1094619 RepID=G5AEV3_PHYSP|nr:hypothetical protein PHYSODRAFT_341943 [Phytophthora sojae]EGZ05743.1 hypothetical protein PHYSODRAFT_341943 [Phytophthora sojae]|eukprot:XP_009538604.1 hypothetical protein PHYSODRAFT_341943 [Phytophthora sojae]
MTSPKKKKKKKKKPRQSSSAKRPRVASASSPKAPKRKRVTAAASGGASRKGEGSCKGEAPRGARRTRARGAAPHVHGEGGELLQLRRPRVEDPGAALGDEEAELARLALAWLGLGESATARENQTSGVTRSRPATGAVSTDAAEVSSSKAINSTFKVRLHPTKEQKSLLDLMFSANRAAYNRFVFLSREGLAKCTSMKELRKKYLPIFQKGTMETI